MNLSATAKHRLGASALGILLLVNASAAPNPNNASVVIFLSRSNPIPEDSKNP